MDQLGDTQIIWLVALAEWAMWMRSAGRPETTIGLRLYQLRRLAADLPHPWTVTLDDLAAWLGSHASWAPQTRRSYRTALRTFYAWAELTGRIERSPAALLPTVTPPRTRPRPAPEDVLREALGTADARIRLMVMLAAYAGLRCGEIARVHSVDLQRDPDGWTLWVTGKGGHVRLVPITAVVAAAIRDRGEGFLFPSQRAPHLSGKHVSKLIARHLPGRWTGHTLRHRFASRAYAAQRDLVAVQELLGHARIDTTRIYTAVPPGALRAAVTAAA